MAITISLGRLNVARGLDRFLAEQMATNGVQALSVQLPHVAQLATLPFHHRDPFDRLWIEIGFAERPAVPRRVQADTQVLDESAAVEALVALSPGLRIVAIAGPEAILRTCMVRDFCNASRFQANRSRAAVH